MKKSLVSLSIIISMIFSSSSVRCEEKTNIENEVSTKVEIAEETEIKTKTLDEYIEYNNDILYSGYFNDIKEKLYKKAKKYSNTVTKEMIEMVFESSDNRKSINESSMEEYFTLVAMHLAIMEIESNFNNDVININSTTKDYGIMQVNTVVIPEAKKGLNDKTLDVYDLHDNVEIGSWEIYKCYKKAKRKHSDNVLWWFYAYYNRGLYFENYPWDYNQANIRSKIFIKKFNKYFKILYNK